MLTLIAIIAGNIGSSAAEPEFADMVMVGGKVITVDARDTVAEALAVKGAKLIAVGSDEEIRKHVGSQTKVVSLSGKTVIPGIIETHCHPMGVARASLEQPYVELASIGEVQSWIRQRSREVPAGRWLIVPRADITRLAERRHPTPAELDAASTTHPVLFNAARKDVLNSLGMKLVGITPTTESIPWGKLIRDEQGDAVLIAGGSEHLRSVIGRTEFAEDEVTDALLDVLRTYNHVGITSIFDRANSRQGYDAWRSLHKAGRLSVRVTVTFRMGARTQEQVEKYLGELGLKPGEGDEWVKAGPLKVTADGGIHWGNTRLREAYGPKRVQFYRLDDPQYRGDFNYTPEQLLAIFRTGHRHGWQLSAHVTGDGGVDRILDAIETIDSERPIRDRRFTLIHAYFPAPDAVARAKRLGVCVDTQPYLYYKDSDAIAEVYGKVWAERLIGLGDWVRGGVPVAINSDHMIGLDPDHAMNSFNPFLMMGIAVTRRNERGIEYGARQKLSRMEALRAATAAAAVLSFDEHRVGSLEPGKFADLVVLDRDVLTCPAEEICNTKVIMTMVGGKTVFSQTPPLH